MNKELKDLLQEMKDVKRTNTEKEMTWGKLDDRIGRETRRNHWQYRTMFTVLLAMLVLFMALLINDSDYTKKNATLPLSKEVRAVHFYETDTAKQFNGKGSKLYLGVEKLTSTAYQQLEELLALQQITQLRPDEIKELESSTFDLIITFQDGHQQRLKWYRDASTEGELLMQDWDTKVFYMIPEAIALELREEIWQFEDDILLISFKGPFILIGSALLYALLTLLIRKKYKLPKKLNFFPQKKWLAVDIIWVSLLFIGAILQILKFDQPLFIGWVILVAIVVCYWQFWINRKLTPHPGYLLLRYLTVSYTFVIIYFMYFSLS
ncbi:hypothetical protein FOH38_01230 [Lysinibacillus fusiformis]|nr:hypothetical protein FOH38_01230 [Lysinibacillus fusiformis]